jgi:hypothetical protein
MLDYLNNSQREYLINLFDHLKGELMSTCDFKQCRIVICIEISLFVCEYEYLSHALPKGLAHNPLMYSYSSLLYL